MLFKYNWETIKVHINTFNQSLYLYFQLSLKKTKFMLVYVALIIRF